jgi:DNA replication protein DnaC
MLLGAMRLCGSVRGGGPELCGRRARAREMFARVAGFPTVKTLDGFDFGFATGVPRQQIHELAGLAFIERAENVVFLGRPCSRHKTHLATSLKNKGPLIGIF